jgi:hypothetical protein
LQMLSNDTRKSSNQSDLRPLAHDNKIFTYFYEFGFEGRDNIMSAAKQRDEPEPKPTSNDH